MATKTYSYLGKGMIYLRNRTQGGGLLPVGNCSALQLSAETETITQPDYTSPGGGNANEIQRVGDVGMNMTMLELRPSNLAMALRGNATEVTGTSVTEEAHTAYPGALVPFDQIPDLNETVTVTIDPGGTATTAVEGTHYERTRAGIVMLEHQDIESTGTAIAVDYTSLTADVVEAMTNSGDEFELVFDGLNEAESGRAVVVTAHRVKWSPTSGLDFIGDEFGELPLEGSVLSDAGITGAGLSRFFKVAMAQ
ncbi:hypothetical protein [Halomonas cerina]|uniref:Major tail protein n=1 Tax=Halomonas cerina TaxID=447424 RepID=A0A839VH84_9GAMM|nr:hypothetical protein [Halomonas cerina]MBB3192047.1 hypothetical protein [Halomonas cerina]